MVVIFRLVVLLMVLLAAGACQSTKSGSETEVQPDSSDLEQLYQEGRAAYLSEDFQAAAETFARVVESDPTHIKALVNWGAALSRGGDPKAAIPKFEQALARDPNHTGAIYNLGVSLERLGKHEAAIVRYKQAVALDSSFLTPEMQTYMERRGPKRQDREINLPGSSPSEPPLPATTPR